METALTNKKQAWLHALRLRTLPLALSSIFLGSFVAHFFGDMHWEVLVLASLTTTFLQILSNLANDYGDSVHGADSKEREGPIRAVQSGVISLPEMKRAMILCGILSFISGIILLLVALQNWKLIVLFIGFGLTAIYAAITYTSGKNPYGYIGLGDISVFIFFGLLGVVGTFFLHNLQVNAGVWLPAISLGLFSTAVLNINNIRDIPSDTLAGKRSIPVRIGRKRAVQYNWLLILGGNMLLLVFAFVYQAWGTLAALLAFPLMLSVAKGVQREKEASKIDPMLKKMAISTLLWVLGFGLGLYFIK
ncbi:1,4-dihydroxy-2-naphthoate polyprenyltransferase [Mongoliitalea daihaiensis]|uniref:1,4-dihydroxy-2-naphthoate polyprenyltransferase n=1 Tax=Mongoliitalea daihaiensis TaxID=2782006 RepID=UPI001F251981|nr:1,4-dihydroxy-2-naphthoate polyprenyltransferase [Mongoliitalea daihaiensis]UJP67061.1 1,4-dihydroxy-2-naphthoate polyprenyltransferase [Mongoliitalea daihaiensis]